MIESVRNLLSLGGPKAPTSDRPSPPRLSIVPAPSRRNFLFGASAFLAAPAIVRVSALMPISVPKSSLVTVQMRLLMNLPSPEYDMAAVATAALRAGGLDLEVIRNLLLPELRGIEAKYEMIPTQLDRIFKPS